MSQSLPPSHASRAAHPLSDRYAAAVRLALQVHRHQARKGTDPPVPYLAHVVAVSAIVLDFGGSETQAIAALLHDTIEDAPAALGSDWVRRAIGVEFGGEVLAIVEACSDSEAGEKLAWIERKTRYVAHVDESPADALLVSAADKLHNAQTILRDYRRVGDEVWKRFKPKAGKVGSLGYYRALTEKFRGRLQNAVVSELDRVVSTLEEAVGERYGWPPGGAVVPERQPRGK